MDLRTYRPELRPAVLAFGSAAGLSWADDPALFVWKYERPLPASAPDSIPRLWLIFDDAGTDTGTGEIVACLGTIPTRVLFQGREYPAAYGVDMRVLPHARGRGLGQRLLEAFADACPIRMMPFASSEGHAMYLAAGYHDVPGATLTVAPVRLLRAGLRAVRHRFGVTSTRERRPPIGIDAHQLSSVLPGCTAERANEPSDIAELDAFLTRCRKRYDMSPGRDWDTLRWRYLEHPHGGGEILSLRDVRGELRSVFAITWRKIRGLNTLLLVDLFVPAGAETETAAIIRAFPKIGQAADADAIGAVSLSADLAGVSRWRNAMRREKYYAIALPSEIHLPVPLGSWYLSAGDSDFIR